MEQYLASSRYIDCHHPAVAAMARDLGGLHRTPVEIAQNCYHFVRDEIFHSADYRRNPVTVKASDVLKFKTGFCYAKSHLLAALLRANGIPAGLCYQRLTIEEERPPFCLHGLNAVYLEKYGWYRIDSRGNKSGIAAEFTPPDEKLAFSTKLTGEADFQGVWPEPLPVIIDALEGKRDFTEVAANLPDISLF